MEPSIYWITFPFFCRPDAGFCQGKKSGKISLILPSPKFKSSKLDYVADETMSLIRFTRSDRGLEIFADHFGLPEGLIYSRGMEAMILGGPSEQTRGRVLKTTKRTGALIPTGDGCASVPSDQNQEDRGDGRETAEYRGRVVETKAEE